jgi:hypothetical protein
VAQLLHEGGYSLQANRKTRDGPQHPDRDAQFQSPFGIRELETGIAFVGAVVHVLRVLERRVGKELRDFRLPDSLRAAKAPDLLVVIADGARLVFLTGCPRVTTARLRQHRPSRCDLVTPHSAGP